MPTIVQMTGFEHGSPYGVRNGLAGHTQFDYSDGTEGGTIVIQNNNTRNGMGYACRFFVTTSAQADLYWCSTGGSPGNSLPVSPILVGRFWWCPESLSGATVATDVPAFAHINSSAGGNSYFEYHENTGQISLVLGSGSTVLSATNTVTVGQWYAIDFRMNMSTNPWTCDWMINGVAQTQATQSAAADNIKEFRIGCTSLFNIVMSYDDIMLSNTTGDYPLPNAHITALPINGSGTNVDQTNFQQTTNDGTSFVAISSPSALVSELPPTVGSSMGAVAQTTADANGYLEFTHASMAAPTGSNIYGVKHIICAYASSGSATNIAVVLQDGSSSGNTLGTPTVPVNPSWSWSNTSLYWQNQMYSTPPSGGGWTQSKVNALKTRIGYSTNITAQPGMNAGYLEVASSMWNLQGNTRHLSVSTAATNQLIAWNFDPTMSNNPYTPGTGKCLAVRCYVDNPQTVNNFYTYVITAGSSLANCYIGLYNSSGTLLGQTANISTALQSTGNITAAAQTPVTGLTKNQEVYLVLLIGSGTSPAFTSATPVAGVSNIGLSSNYRWESGGTSLTALPSTLPTMSAAGSEPPFLAMGN